MDRRERIALAYKLAREGMAREKMAAMTGLSAVECRSIKHALTLSDEANGIDTTTDTVSAAKTLIELMKARKDKGVGVHELSDYPAGTIEAMHVLGYDVQLLGERIVLESQFERLTSHEPISVFEEGRKHYRFGVISDSHFGGMNAQPDFIREVFQYAGRTNAQAMFHVGDHVEGSPKMHKEMIYELGLHKADDQADYTASLYAECPVPFFGIGGNHDGNWYKEAGLNIGRMIQERSKGVFQYIGSISAWVSGPNGDPHFMRLFHPHDGCSYAYSYKDQKTMEYLSVSNDHQPTGFHFTGHYHKHNKMRGPLGALYFLQPSSCGLSSYMSSKRLINTAGAIFIDFELNKAGQPVRVTVEDLWLPPSEYRKCDYTEFKRRPKLIAETNVWG